MGKNNKQFSEDRNTLFDVSSDINNNDDDIIATEYNLDEKNMYRLDTSILLRKRLIEYSQNAGFTLCEHLDINNVDNFVEWILKNA